MRLHRILTLSGRLNLDVTGISGYTINSEIKIRYKGGAVYAEDKKAVNRVFCACFISCIVCTGDGRCGD